MQKNTEPSQVAELLIPWRTLFKIALFVLLVFVFIKLRILGAMLLAATLIAVTMEPIASSAVRRGFPRWAGVALCALLIFGLVGGFIALLVPKITEQGSAMIERLPTMRTDFLNQLPSAYDIRQTAEQYLAASVPSDPKPLVKSFVAGTAVAVEGLATFLIILVIAIYLVADGESVYRWLAAFLPKRLRPKADTTARELASVIRRWITGQAIASLCAAVYTFTVLSILKVPGASILAVLAAVFDVLPVIGFFCAVVPAMASALTVSPTSALIVLGAYVAYHLLETYVIIPKVFGDQLKLSMLAVLLACLAAGYLAGPLAILFALPLVACYPVIERLWLKPYLQSDTVEKHEEIEG